MNNEHLGPGIHLEALTDENFSQARAGDAFTAFLKAFCAAFFDEIYPEKLMWRREMQFDAVRCNGVLEKYDGTTYVLCSMCSADVCGAFL